MSLVIDLADVDAKDRPARWSGTIRGEYLDVDIRFSGRQPAGKIVRSSVASIILSTMTSVAQVHERSEAMALDDGIDWIAGAMQLDGHSHFAQHGREADLRPGQFLIFDTAAAFRADFPDDHKVLFMAIPRAIFQRIAHHRTDVLNVCVDERRGSGLVLDYFQRIKRDSHRLSIEQQAHMSALGLKLMLDTAAASIGLKSPPDA